jgi:hypothetical protein
VREKALEQWKKVREEWKNDPGIKYICYYSSGATGSGKYAQNWLFEVGDALKGQEVQRQFYRTLGPFDKYGWDIVFGSTEIDEFWLS